MNPLCRPCNGACCRGGDPVKPGPDEPCPDFDVDTNRCRIYDERPYACRVFVPGCAMCKRFQLLYLGVPA